MQRALQYLVLSLVLIAFPACDSGGGGDDGGGTPMPPTDDVGEFLNALPSWNSFAPSEPDRPASPTGEATTEEVIVEEVEEIDEDGMPDTIRAAWDATRNGGTTVVVGAGGLMERVSFNCAELFVTGRTLKACVYGSAHVHRDFRRFLDLWQAGRLDLDGLITARIALSDINGAFDDMRNGTGLRSVVVFD